MYFDPVQSTDIYTKQCAIAVNAKDLAVMAATLANGGYNPITKKTVVKPETVKYVLPVMATAGLYDDAGESGPESGSRNRSRSFKRCQLPDQPGPDCKKNTADEKIPYPGF